MTSSENQKSCIRIGVSRCLLGDEVRYDGGHKHDPFLTGVLSKHFTWVPVCPEMEIGLGSPRESMRLVEIDGKVHLVTNKTERDFTDTMDRFAVRRISELNKEQLHGFILKKDSPSCGLFRVKVHQSNGSSQKQGRGLFAEALVKKFPNLPVEEEGRLNDLKIRENFIERIFAYYRWLEFLESKPRAADLVLFHSRQKMAILAHSKMHYQKLGQLVARSGKAPIKRILSEYAAIYMDALKQKATTQKHANVLFHLMGYFKKSIDTNDKSELVQCVEDYRKGLVPLIVPITLLQHHLRHHPVPWLSEQSYMNPYPAELMLRNHV